MAEKANILIVGAGKGGTALIELLSESKTTNIMAVVDINPNACGIKLAKELGIPTGSGYKKFLNKNGLDEIINVTGSEKVHQEIMSILPSGVELIAGHSAKLIWSLLEERTRTEEKLRQSRELMQLQIKRMPIGCIMWDHEFRVVSWNPAAEEIFGFSAGEALGKHPYDIIVPKEAQPHVDIIWRHLLEGDIKANSVNENLTKDGRPIICDWSNTPLKKADGTVMGVLSMVRDITERKQMEEKLKRSEEKYRNLTEHLSELIYRADPITLVANYVNKAVGEIYGYTQEEWLSNLDLWVQRLHPEDKDRVAEFFKEAQKNKQDSFVEYRIIRKDKSTRWVIDRFSWEKDREGRLVALNGVLSDITEHKQAEETLRASEERFRSVFNNLAVGIAVVDKNGYIVAANKADCDFLGYPEQELMSKHLREVYLSRFSRQKIHECIPLV